MYKNVDGVTSRYIGPPQLRIQHLSEPGFYYETMDGRVLETVEIVQGYAGVPLGLDYRNRSKKKA